MPGRPQSAEAPTALVLDGDDGAAIEALQALASQNVQVDVAGPDGALIFASRLYRRSFLQPPSHEPAEFISWLREMDERASYALIVPATNRALWPFLTLSDADPLRSKAVLPSTRSLEIAQDKVRTRALARQLGIAIPESRVIEWLEGAPPAPRFPLLLTPARQAVHSLGRLREFQSVMVDNEEQRKAHLSYLIRHVPVLEEWQTAGERWGITLLYEHGHARWHCAHRRLHELSPGGVCTYRQTMLAPDDMLRSATRLLDALEWHGVATVEFLVSESDGALLTMVESALGDSLALLLDAGVDLPGALLRLASGEPLPPQPVYSVPHSTRCLRRDASWIKSRLRSGEKIEALAEGFKAVFPWLVGESWDNFEWRDLGVTRAILHELWSSGWIRMEERIAMRGLEGEARRVHEINLKRLFETGRQPRRILFLCYGNICRSPVAAALAARAFPEGEVSSAGFFDMDGRSSPDNIRWAARQLGLDPTRWSSRLVTDDMVAAADVVFVMDLYNFRDFRARFRWYLDKVLLLGMFGDPPSPVVRDPYQKGPEETVRVLRQLERAVSKMASRLTRAGASASAARA